MSQLINAQYSYYLISSEVWEAEKRLQRNYGDYRKATTTPETTTSTEATATAVACNQEAAITRPKV